MPSCSLDDDWYLPMSDIESNVWLDTTAPETRYENAQVGLSGRNSETARRNNSKIPSRADPKQSFIL